MKRFLFAVTLLLSFLGDGEATTFLKPSVEDMTKGTVAVIIGEVKNVGAFVTGDGKDRDIYTYVQIDVSRVVAGKLPSNTIVLRERGGTTKDAFSIVFGSPVYERGEKVLVFLVQNKDGSLRTSDMMFGKYTLNDKDDLAILNLDSKNSFVFDPNTRKLGSPPTQTGTTVPSLLDRIDPRLIQPSTTIRAIPPEFDLERFRTLGHWSYFYQITPSTGEPWYGSKYRWDDFDFGLYVPIWVDSRSAQGHPGMGEAISRIVDWAYRNWMDDPNSNILLTFGGWNFGSVTESCYADAGSREEAITVSFNDWQDLMDDTPTGSAGCTRTIAQSCIGGSGTVTLGNGITLPKFRYVPSGASVSQPGDETFYRIARSVITFNQAYVNTETCYNNPVSTWSECTFSQVLSHEMGHSLGLGHDGDTSWWADIDHNHQVPTGGDHPLMYPYATVWTPWGTDVCPWLGASDQEGIAHIYPMSMATPPTTVYPTRTPYAATPTWTPKPTDTEPPTPTITLTPTPTWTPWATPVYSCPNLTQEGSTMTFTCPNNGLIWAVAFASYGNPGGAYPTPTNTPDTNFYCCQGHTAIFPASNPTCYQSIGTPCNMVGNPDIFIGYQYRCSPYNGASNGVCVTVTPGGVGTPTPKPTPPLYPTPNPATWSCEYPAVGTCDAPTSMDVVRAACINQHSCSIPVNDTTFNDTSCSTITKTLGTAFYCIPVATSTAAPGTATRTPTITPTPSKTRTPTRTPTPTRTNTYVYAPTKTPTKTVSPTRTKTGTPTKTYTRTRTPTRTPTRTRTPLPAKTTTKTRTPTRTIAPTNTRTPTQTKTPTFSTNDCCWRLFGGTMFCSAPYKSGYYSYLTCPGGYTIQYDAYCNSSPTGECVARHPTPTPTAAHGTCLCDLGIVMANNCDNGYTATCQGQFVCACVPQ